MERLWDRDPTVWGDPDLPEVANRLGWLGSPSTSRELLPRLEELTSAARDAGITDVVLCGMGCSSLAPGVFAHAFAGLHDGPRLTVVDSTHPDAVTAVDRVTAPDRTWYLISSKSGTTLETLSLFHFFWERASNALTSPGHHFVAVTDPGSPLAALATERGFRAVVEADPDVGGRYSALTAFGLVPAALIGVDPTRLLDAATAAVTTVGPDVDLLENPAFLLGATMATNALSGVDKIQLVAEGAMSRLPAWIEQLIAESTGKDGKGIVPVDGGPFPSAASDGIVTTIDVPGTSPGDLSWTTDGPYDVAAAMFVFELATAIAGEILGINPFDQPDVEIAKRLAASAMQGELAVGGPPVVAVDDPGLAALLSPTLTAPGTSYVSFHAYLAPTDDTDRAIASMRGVVDGALGVYTTAGYGPRFLHSTGQIHKGGPPGGVYLQMVDQPEEALAVPGTDFAFRDLIAAQAAGDRAALADRGRTVIGVDLGTDTAAGLRLLLEVIRSAVS